MTRHASGRLLARERERAHPVSVLVGGFIISAAHSPLRAKRNETMHLDWYAWNGEDRRESQGGFWVGLGWVGAAHLAALGGRVGWWGWRVRGKERVGPGEGRLGSLHARARAKRVVTKRA
jgi:hypothetical protein